MALKSGSVSSEDSLNPIRLCCSFLMGNFLISFLIRPQPHSLQKLYLGYSIQLSCWTLLHHFLGDVSLKPCSHSLSVWPLDQQSQHHLRTCEKCKCVGPNLNLLSQKLEKESQPSRWLFVYTSLEINKVSQTWPYGHIRPHTPLVWGLCITGCTLCKYCEMFSSILTSHSMSEALLVPSLLACTLS